MNLHEFVDWFYKDLSYKAPEQWPSMVAWFLTELRNRYEPVEEIER